MKQRVINGNSLEFYNSDNSKKGEIKISGSDVIINPIDSSGTVIFGEEGTINDIEVGASGTPVDFTFLGGGTITPNGGTLTLGESGDTIDLSNATIGTITASIFKGGQFIGDGSGLSNTPSTFTNITASGDISSSGMGTFAQVRIGESTTTNYGLIVDYPETRLLQLKRGGSVKFKVIADNSDGQVDIYDNSGNSDIRFLADGDSYITNNLGIGTTSPEQKLTVESGYISVTGSGASGYGYELARAGLDTYRIQHLDGGLTIFNQTDTRKEMTFYGNGNVGIGNNTPDELLTVEGNISASGIIHGTSFKIGASTVLSGQTDVILGSAGATGTISLNTHGGTIFKIDGNDNILIRTGSASVVGGTARMTVDVGSGTASPISFVNGTTDGMYIRRYDSSGKYQIQTTVGSGNSGVFSLQTYGGNVGIGTTTAAEKLTVEGDISASGDLHIKSDNIYLGDNETRIRSYSSYLGLFAGGGSAKPLKVGSLAITNDFDDSAPTNGLFVKGNISSSGHISSSGLYVESSTITDFIKLNSLGSSANPIKLIFEKSSTEQGIIEYNRNGDLEIYNTDGDGGVMIDGSTSAGGDLYVANSGKVGIGTTSPPEKLTVEGNISASGTGSFAKMGIGNVTQGSYFLNVEGYSRLGGVDLLSGVVYADSARINNFQDKTNNTFSSIFHSGASRTITFMTSGSNRMILDSDGNLGIGNLTPSEKLTVEGNISASGTGSFSDGRFTGRVGINRDEPLVSLHVVGSIYANTGDIFIDSGNRLKWGNSNQFIEGTNDTSLEFGTGGSTKMYLNNSGNVGIGTTSPGEKLTVEGNISASGALTGGSLDINGNADISGNLTLSGGALIGDSNWNIYAEYTNRGRINLLSANSTDTTTQIALMTNGNNRLTIDKAGTSTFTGDVVVAGTLTAQEFHTEFVSASIMFESGSTKFGDTDDDIHQFTGSVHIQTSGSAGNNKLKLTTSAGNDVVTIMNANSDTFPVGAITVQYGSNSAGQIVGNSNTLKLRGGNSTAGKILFTNGSGGADELAEISSDGLEVKSGHITSSGNISASGNLIGSQIQANNGIELVGNLNAPDNSRIRLGSSADLQIYHDSSNSYINDTGTGNLILMSSQTTFQTSGANRIFIKDSGTEFLTHITASGNISASGTITANSFVGSFTGGVTGDATGLTGTPTITVDDINVSGDIVHNGDADTKISLTNDDINIKVGNVNMLDFTENAGSQDEITFNEEGVDLDIRMEGDTDQNLFFLDAGNDKIGIGTSTPGEKLEVVGNISASGRVSGLDYAIDGNLLVDMAGSTIALGYQNNTPISIGRSANPINLIGQVTASNISSSGLIKTNTLNIASTADGGATIGNDQILHAGNITTIETTAANLTVGQATVATNVTAVATTDNAEFFVGVLDGASGNQVVETSTRLKYNPNSGKLTVSGDISSSSDITANNLVIAGDITSVGDDVSVGDNILLTSAAGQLQFTGTSGGGNEGITYKDSGGGNRYGLLFPGSNVVALANRASNGTVQIRANTSTAGSGGEVTVAEFEDNIAKFNTNISSSGYVYSKNVQYWSTTGRLTTGNNTTNYYGPNPQGTNYYFWNRDLGTSSTTITAKTTTLNSGWKLPYKAVLTGYHLNIQGRSTNDNIEFTLVYSDGMWGGDVTSTSQTLVEAESGQTVSIATSNNFYELDRRGQFAIPVSAMTMLYPRFKKTAATGGTAYDFQLAVEYYVVQ